MFGFDKLCYEGCVDMETKKRKLNYLNIKLLRKPNPKCHYCKCYLKEAERHIGGMLSFRYWRCFNCGAEFK
jgi:hypothetical protein